MMNNKMGSWMESTWSDAEGNKVWWQMAKDSNGEYIRTMTVDNHGNPIKFDDLDISELDSLSR